MLHTDTSLTLCDSTTAVSSRDSNNMFSNMVSSFFSFSVDSHMSMIYPWLIHAVYLLRMLVILGLPSSVNLSVIHTLVYTWLPNFAFGSFILWPPQHPFFGTSSVPSSVIIASLWSAKLCFRIIFCRCLGVSTVVYASYRYSSGVSANPVIT